MKRILITVLITLFCFGIGATSFVVNDLSSYVKWYQNELQPNMEKNKKDKAQQKRQKEEEKHWERTKHNQDNLNHQNTPQQANVPNNEHSNAPSAAQSNTPSTISN
ncbi:hypothetical protein [uncultured Veillonella sp.]|uniref:hypothetical protein n=1 Tax=uncultured Veillonella sp. TaxID=159268 RepID=UPI0025F13B69|nr:hypothetical protein [uncultured Veillonella sp.]